MIQRSSFLFKYCNGLKVSKLEEHTRIFWKWQTIGPNGKKNVKIKMKIEIEFTIWIRNRRINRRLKNLSMEINNSYLRSKNIFITISNGYFSEFTKDGKCFQWFKELELWLMHRKGILAIIMRLIDLIHQRKVHKSYHIEKENEKGINKTKRRIRS